MPHRREVTPVTHANSTASQLHHHCCGPCSTLCSALRYRSTGPVHACVSALSAADIAAHYHRQCAWLCEPGCTADPKSRKLSSSIRRSMAWQLGSSQPAPLQLQAASDSTHAQNVKDTGDHRGIVPVSVSLICQWAHHTM